MGNFYNNVDIDNLINSYGSEYLSEINPDSEPFSMDDLDEFLEGKKPSEIIRLTFHGERYGYKRDNFNPNDDWFTFNAYGNLVSIPYIDEYLENEIDEDDFLEWCKDHNYIDD